MAIGPIQLLVLGFEHPEFKGELLDELQRLREKDTIRVIDSLAVWKNADGEAVALEMSNLTADESIELGTKVGALIGFGAAGEEGLLEGARIGAERAESGPHVFDEKAAWDVLESIPNDSAAVMLLIEHHWAVGLRDAVIRANGYRIGDDFISPYDLVRIGMLAAEDAESHVALDKSSAAS